MKLFDLIEAEKALKDLVNANVHDLEKMRELQLEAVTPMVKLYVEIIKHSQKEIEIETV
jgi:hypothetical protein